MKKNSKYVYLISIGVTILFGLYGFMMMLGLLMGFPVPRGSKVDKRYYTYYQNYKGIYYISIENAFFLYNHGSWGYLEDADKDSFKVLASSWTMDKNHVWNCENIVEGADIETFRINESGVPVDRNNVYVWNEDYELVASQSGIDPKTAEYFISRNDFAYHDWLRDKDNVYYRDNKVDVDRGTFSKFDNDLYVDKDFLYTTRYNRDVPEKWDFIRLDSLQEPLVKANKGKDYIRNGRNIIYASEIILKDVDVQRFEVVSYSICAVNDTLFHNGKPFLKDSINVPEARFYGYGVIADNENVFWCSQRLDDIDAATFKKINDETFEDKDYIYTVKDTYRIWEENYPFDKRSKLFKSLKEEKGKKEEKTSSIPFRLFLILFLGVSALRIWRF